MKKLLGVFITSVLLLSGCSFNENSADMTINSVKFTQEENALIELLNVEQIPYLWDFTLDGSVKSITINYYEFIDGKWDNSGKNKSQIAFEDTHGHLALTFDNIANGMTTSLQSENHTGSSSHATEAEFNFENMASSTSIQSNPLKIVYDEEIPLVIQIHSSSDTISSLIPEIGFVDTTGYENHEKVYAITITFSEKTVGQNIEE